ncbi:MAG: lamin tail domain-containing protein [Ignavibacteria bacterium]|nr:lamin tail domain-containing protein [Ignavibacteria bacterium]
MKKFLLILILIERVYAQNPLDVVINEIMYAPGTGTSQEWFEIYNRSASAINLNNWKWKDATATLRIFTNQNVILPAGGYALICQDTNAVKSFYTGVGGILLQPTNGWSALNNTGDDLIIFNSSNLRIDSITFTSSWGGSSGNRSLERRNPNGPTNLQSNWGTSVAAIGATPNIINSLTPRNNDLSLNVISFTNPTPIIGSNFQIIANIKNTGLLSAPSFSVSFYRDYNRDSIPNASELFFTTNSSAPLNPGDSVNFFANETADSLGQRFYIAVVNYSPDEDSTNNRKRGFVNVLPVGGLDSVVINEIMYAPSANTGKEWFEIYNKSPNAVNLNGWKWKDATSTIRVITNSNVIIQSGGFAVICEDSNAVKSFYPNNPGIYIQSIGWNALNNTGDEDVIIINPSDVRIDSVRYNNSWGGSSGNRSLERRFANVNSNLQSNWGTSLNPIGATPNKINSITPKPNDLSVNRISFSKQVPSVGDTLGVIARVWNPGLNPAPNYTVSFYNDYNRDSLPSQNELLGIISSKGGLNPNDSVNVVLNHILDTAGLRIYIAVVNYAPDEDTTNNKFTAGINVIGGSTAGRVLINEIMYDPPSGENEWVELYNNSDSTVNLRNWRIQDNGSTQYVITANDYELKPQDYVVISKNDSIFRRHPGIDSLKVIINSSLPTLNNDFDAVVIYKLNGELSDRVDYRSSWGGSKTSLERLSVQNQTQDSLNWVSSIACRKSTPTAANSAGSVSAYELNDLVINEIMAAPLSGDPEWIELYNPTGKTINLSGWLFSESSSSKKITDTCNALIKPGMYAVIAADTNIYNRFPYLRDIDSTRRVFISGSLGLNNEGDLVMISDLFRNKIDSLNYSDRWYNPNLPGNGRSLEKINPLLPSNNSTSWSSSANLSGGTPGYRNSIYTDLQPVTSQISVSPNPFSPDNDGFEDFTVISYKLSAIVSQVRIKIFDVKGRLIKTLINNMASGSEGQVVYNGLDDDNRKLRLGIYIVFLEAINDQNGVVERLKTTMVVAAKL